MSGNDVKKKRGRILSWGLNLAGILIFVLILWLGGVKAWQQIVRGDWRYILAALGVTLLWNLVAAYRWSLIAGDLNTDVADCPFRYYFTYHMIGMFLGQVVPITVGMLGGRPVALSLSRGVSLKRSALSVFMDKLFDLVLALLLVIPVALYLIDWIDLGLAFGLMAATVAAAALAVAWQYEAIISWAGQLGARLARPLGRLPVIGQRLPAQLDRLAAERLLSNRLALRSFLLTLVLYALLSARLFFISEALRLDIPWHLFALGVCVAQLALVFSVTPGSLGFLETGWAAVLGLAGLTVEQFTIFVLGRRAYFMLFTLLCTLLAFAWIRESPARLFRAVWAASRQGTAGPPEGEAADPHVA
ncbi:MAG: lysylphosphatidylglycerol synthase transmembrane domain-containing protein [Anaerolineae bacterium]|jgi:uncharacterized protein (TIRG00374 family)